MSQRQGWVVVVVLFLAGAAWGDIVYLKSGGTLEGDVVEQGDKITVTTKAGPLVLDKSQVLKVEKRASKEEEYRLKAAAIKDGDATAHYELGMWCKGRGLRVEAQAEFEKALQIDPEHEKTRQELGQVKIDGAWQKAEPGKIHAGEGVWLTPVEAVENAQAEYKLGKYADAQKKVERALEIGMPATERTEAQILLGKLCERQGKWTEALQAYDCALRSKGTPEQRAQVECRRTIIKESENYMYLIRDSSASGKENIFTVDSKDPEAPKTKLTGLQPLTDGAVMFIAIRDKATEKALKAKDTLEQAKKAEDGTEKGRIQSLRLLDKVEDECETANLLAKDIARGFQVECARQRIGMLERYLEQQISAVDAQQAALSGRGRSIWKQKLPTLYKMLTELEKTLSEIDGVARAYPDELADETAKVKAYRTSIENFKVYIKSLHDSL